MASKWRGCLATISERGAAVLHDMTFFGISLRVLPHQNECSFAPARRRRLRGSVQKRQQHLSRAARVARWRNTASAVAPRGRMAAAKKKQAARAWQKRKSIGTAAAGAYRRLHRGSMARAKRHRKTSWYGATASRAAACSGHGRRSVAGARKS